uniref:Uncharacterized protein n=1 Tax=Xiphophorus maculatus TaxID=8083 RepID=A0A3B5QV18_XIPMA
MISLITFHAFINQVKVTQKTKQNTKTSKIHHDIIINKNNMTLRNIYKKFNIFLMLSQIKTGDDKIGSSKCVGVEGLRTGGNSMGSSYSVFWYGKDRTLYLVLLAGGSSSASLFFVPIGLDFSGRKMGSSCLSSPDGNSTELQGAMSSWGF